MNPALHAAALLATTITSTALAELRLPSVFSDHMVLQRDQHVPVWGKGDPGETVTVTLGDRERQTVVDDDGTFVVHFAPLDAGGPFELVVRSGTESIAFADVLVGEVWVTSGQSNMEWTVTMIDPADTKALLESAGDPQLRLFLHPKTIATEPQFDNGGQWATDNPENVKPFSAVAYYFGRQLREELDVPVGIIATSWGGTPAEAWTPKDVLASDPITAPLVERDTPDDEDTPAYIQAINDRYAKYKEAGELIDFHPEPANTGFDKGYANVDFDDSAWESRDVTSTWEAQEPERQFDGVVWFRTDVDLPDELHGEPLTLMLGAIDDMDTTYVNGVMVEQTNTDTSPTPWSDRRSYDIPAELTEAGTLTIAVRVFDWFGNGGFIPGVERRLVGPGGEVEKLPETWKSHVEHELDTALARGPSGLPFYVPGKWIERKPGRLFNGMIAPIVPFGVRGVIWYQGESNAGRAEQYETLFPMMIQSWRDAWREPEMPFGFVQLASFKPYVDEPSDTDWSHLREAQRMTLDKLDHTGMAVAIDIGEADDIHPRNKADVGDRLARWALHDVYGETDVVRGGPTFEQARTLGNRVLVRFGDVADGLQTRGGERLGGFTVAGADGVFHEATAVISDDRRSVLVGSDAVPGPVAVRYAWKDNPEDANLINSVGLPAGPFRTDNLPGPTDGRR
ncbi:MAG: sialate O-acetylesterase [Planctomycetota bacterium]